MTRQDVEKEEERQTYTALTLLRLLLAFCQSKSLDQSSTCRQGHIHLQCSHGDELFTKPQTSRAAGHTCPALPSARWSHRIRWPLHSEDESEHPLIDESVERSSESGRVREEGIGEGGSNKMGSVSRHVSTLVISYKVTKIWVRITKASTRSADWRK